MLFHVIAESKSLTPERRQRWASCIGVYDALHGSDELHNVDHHTVSGNLATVLDGFDANHAQARLKIEMAEIAREQQPLTAHDKGKPMEVPNGHPFDNLINMAEGAAVLASEVFSWPHNPTQEEIHALDARQTALRSKMYEAADAALRFGTNQGISFSDIEARVKHLVGVGNGWLEWSWKHRGQAPSFVENEDQEPSCSPSQLQALTTHQEYRRMLDNAKGDLLRLKIAYKDNSPPSQSDRLQPELTSTEKTVLDIIRSQPSNQGINGKEIITRLKDKGISYEESTLRKHCLPKLKKYGVINHRARGGYLIEKPV